MQILSRCSVLKMTIEYPTQFPKVDKISAMQIRGRKFCLHLLYICQCMFMYYLYAYLQREHLPHKYSIFYFIYTCKNKNGDYFGTCPPL